MTETTPKQRIPAARTGIRPAQAGYDAAKGTQKRQRPRALTMSEDKALDTQDRKKLIATVRDQQRNFAVLAWMIRKHINSVCRFTFQSKSGDKAFDRRLESAVESWSAPTRFDAAGRHGLRRFLSLSEMRRVCDGDIGWMPLADGTVQAIESDRIHFATPPEGADAEDVRHGVWLAPGGRARAYGICKRVGTSGLEQERIVSADHFWLHGYFTRFDQSRGISPLSSAVNMLQDAYESIDLNLVKAKVHALFGILFFRDADPDDPKPGQPSLSDDEAAELTDEEREAYEVPFGSKFFSMDLDPGDKFETVESKTPPLEFQTFMELTIRLALLALDIPYSAFDSRASSYSAQRQDLLGYVESCKDKRDDNRDLLTRWFRWRLSRAVASGEFSLPGGMTVADVRYEWQAAGVPWIDPLKEALAWKNMIEQKLMSRQQISRQLGRDWDDIADELEAEAARFASAPTPNEETA